MRVLASRKGFSLVELLTVIAIIAILASIIFPVMSVVSNNARTNKCITQLHQIGLGLQMFKADNRRYPDILASTVQYSGSNVIPADKLGQNQDPQAPLGLFPEYVKAIRLFHCPCSKELDTTAIADIPGSTYKFYPYDSYDFFRLSASQIQQHYSREWAVNIDGVKRYPADQDSDALQTTDYERQLKFRTPPETTVITWCSYHETAGPTGKAPTLFLDGHVDKIDAAITELQKYRTMPKKE